MQLLGEVFCAQFTCTCLQSVFEVSGYWAVQAGLFTPLTFTLHHLSPLAVFTSSVYFLHNGRL